MVEGGGILNKTLARDKPNPEKEKNAFYLNIL